MGETKKESGQQLKSNKINLQDYKARLNVKSPLNAAGSAASNTNSPPKIYDQNITSTTNEQTSMVNGKIDDGKSKKIKASGEPLISTTTDNMPFNENEITSTNVVANGSPSSGTTSTAQNQQSMIMTPPPSNSSIIGPTNVGGTGGSMASHSVSPSSSSIPKSETGKEWY